MMQINRNQKIKFLMLVVLLKKLIIIPDISNLVTKTALTAIENKISNISNLAAKTALTTVENKIPDISNLATKAALTIVENKIPDISNLATKAALTIFEKKKKNSDISNLVKNSDYIRVWQYNRVCIRVQFTGSSLKQPSFTFTHKKIVNIYIVYELRASSSHINDPTLKNCLFGAVTLTKNSDIDKYRYSGYGIRFDRRGSFHFQVVDFVKM